VGIAPLARVTIVTTEHGVLLVKPGEEEAFEAAFAVARKLILASPGCAHLSLSRCVERSHAYLLLVEWERIEDHLEGFRGSPAFLEWRRLLHHFYDPAPVIEHFEPIFSS
jgi:heme-degrading monooxygenase HmoA